MRFILLIIIEAHLYMLCTILASYVVERITGLKLLIEHFKWKKSNDMARGSAGLHSILYFMFSLGVMIYHVYIRESASVEYTFWKWLAIMLPLTVLFGFQYYRLQGRDPSKKGEHYD